MRLDVNTLTLGEIAKVEELSGQPITALGEDDRPQGLLLAALVFTAQRREDHKATWNAACGLTFEQANQYLGFNEPPADADDEPSDDDELTPDPTPQPARTRRKSTS